MSTDSQSPPAEITDKFGQVFCYVPARSYLAGEQNVETRVPASFYIGKYAVTRAMYRRFLDETGYNFEPVHHKRMDHISPLPDCPVSPVSWWDAKYFIRWLRHTTDEYYSLPLEIEWELAARGDDGRLFPWGNAIPDDTRACCSTDFKRTTTDAVGSHPSGDSPYGCSDMVGNVWEYCLDDLDVEGQMHVVRGGSARNPITNCTTVARAFVSPATLRVNYAGFRLLYLPGDMYDDYVAALNDFDQVDAVPEGTITMDRNDPAARRREVSRTMTLLPEE